MKTLTALIGLFFCWQVLAIEYYFYVNGDNDLIEIGKSGEVFHLSERFIEQITRWSQNSKEHGFHIYWDRYDKDTEFFSICNGEIQTKDKVSESNSLSPENLEKVLSFSCNNDALKYLFFWGHGSSWTNFNFDYSENDQGTFKNLFMAIPDHHFESIIFDACSLASVETAFLLRNKTKSIIASQFNLPGEGIQYPINGSTFNSSYEFYSKLFELTKESQIKKKVFAPIIYIDMEHFDSFLIKFNNLFEKIIPLKEQLTFSYMPSSIVADEYSVSLKGFLKELEKIPELKDTSHELYLKTHLLLKGYGSINFHLPILKSNHFIGLKNWQLEIGGNNDNANK